MSRLAPHHGAPGLTLFALRPSIASIHAARIHSLLLTFTAPLPTPVAIPQPVLGFEDFSIGLEGTTVGTLLDSLADQDGQAAWSWNDWSMTPMQDTEWGLWGAGS